MFSSNTLAKLAADPANSWLEHRLTGFSKIMSVLESKGKELYEQNKSKKRQIDTCGTSTYKIWVMESGFGPSIHLEYMGEHWSFWISDDDPDLVESYKHENNR